VRFKEPPAAGLSIIDCAPEYYGAGACRALTGATRREFP
jgi:hypothetical protein